MRQPNYGNGMYAYITEIVQTCSEYDDNNWYADYNKRLTHLRVKLEKKVEFRFSDSHRGNFGFKRSVMVCIDFDEF